MCLGGRGRGYVVAGKGVGAGGGVGGLVLNGEFCMCGSLRRDEGEGTIIYGWCLYSDRGGGV